MTAHIASGDCERCRPGPVAQPVNTASSLAYVAVGCMVLRANRRRTARRSESAIGWAAVAAGLGSVAYHGPGTAAGRYVHDASLLALVGLIAVADVENVAGRQLPVAALAAVPAVAAVAAHPRTSIAAQAVGGASAVAGAVARHVAQEVAAQQGAPPPTRHRRWGLAEAMLAGAGVVAHLGGRTGGPWCRPDSVLQPHAAWHVATAAVIWFRSVDVR